MRICHIISGDLWAGAEVMCYQLLKNLLNFTDLEIILILLNEGKLAEEVRKLGIKVVVVDETKNNIFQIVKIFRNTIKHASPHIIHSHRLKENILAYLSSKSDENIQIICTQHGMPEPIILKYKMLKHATLSKIHLYILSKYFRYVIAVSDELRNKFIKKYSFNKEKIIFIHNGVDIPNDYYINRDSDIFVIGSAGRLYKIKDYPFMVEIANEVLQKAGHIRFELAGEGPENENIQENIRKLGIGKDFKLTGFIDNIATFYETLDLYINTSLHEGLPMSILEAMAYGLPIIANNSGGLPEIVENGLHGYLIDERNPKMFAQKCIQLFNDKELTRKMGIASRERIINEFSVQRMAEKYYKVYKYISKH